MKPFDRITSSPNQTNGQPCIRNMRSQCVGYWRPSLLYPRTEDEDTQDESPWLYPPKPGRPSDRSTAGHMKLLLDQGLPRGAAPRLRAQGLDVLHVGEIGMARADDVAVLHKARNEGRVVRWTPIFTLPLFFRETRLLL